MTQLSSCRPSPSPSPSPVVARLPGTAHLVGGGGIALWVAAALLWGAVPGGGSALVGGAGVVIGAVMVLLYGQTLARMARGAALTVHIRCDGTALVVVMACEGREWQIARHALSDLTDCGLMPVDSGFSSLWRPYVGVGVGVPPRRLPLPLRCRGDLRRVPPEGFATLLDHMVAVLDRHHPQALLRLRQQGAAYG